MYQRYFRLAFENGYDTEMGIQRNDRYDRDRDRDRDSNSNRDRDRNSDRGRDRWGRNWDRYGNYGGSFQLRQTALNAGYNEGMKAGRDDRRRGRYNPTRYSNTLKDYNSRMGDRYTYQQYFMQAFQNGYADGYRGV